MVKVHVWSEPPYWRLSLCSTPRDMVREVTLPSFLMSFRAVSFSQMLAFCLQLWEIMHFDHGQGCYKSWRNVHLLKKKQQQKTLLLLLFTLTGAGFVSPIDVSSMATTCNLVSPILLATVLKLILFLITTGYITAKKLFLSSYFSYDRYFCSGATSRLWKTKKIRHFYCTQTRTTPV